MFPTFISILDIQSWWEVPSIAHFCSLFRAAFNLLDFDIEDLEEALLTDGTEETSWLQELIVRLLSGCLANNDISTFNYQMFLRRLFRQKCQEHDRYNPFNTDIDFQFLPLRTKVEILQALCDFRLDAEDVLDHLKNLEADSLRVEPLGYDDNESAYWYFYGTRLYREDHTFKNSKKVKSVWQVICFTEEDWYQLARKFRKSSSKVERQLYRTLSENFLPELPRLFQEKEVLHRKRLLEWLPRRTSARLDIKRQQIKEPDVPTSDLPPQKETTVEQAEAATAAIASENHQNDDDDANFDAQSADNSDTVKTRKKHHKGGYEKGKKRKESPVDRPAAPSSTSPNITTSPNSKRKPDSNAKRHATEMAERRKQRELRSARDTKPTKDKDKDKEKEKDKAKHPNKEKGAATSGNTLAPGATPVGRQTNNSLASATGQIVIQSVSNPNRKKLKTSQVFRQSAEDLQTGMYKILEAVKNHEDAWPFVEPVEEEYAPNYYTVIRRPMDLQRMEDKLDMGAYVSYGKFRQDFQLIVDNCRLYNGTDNEYTEMVDNLQQAFQRATDRYLDQISSSDEEIAVEFQGSTKDSRTTSTSNTQTKRKKPDSATTTPVTSKRKPTSMAHTADKRERERSMSVESNHSLIKSPEVTDKPDKTKNDKPQKNTRSSKVTATTKTAKNAKNDAKVLKHNRRGKKMQSPERSRSRSRSPKKNNKSPSWPPSSPEHWKSAEKRDTSPSVTSARGGYSSEEEKKIEKPTKTKGKHKHWKEVFKDKEKKNQVKTDKSEKPDKVEKIPEKEVSKPKEIIKPKNKNPHLSETIEKLKAKSELALSDDGILRKKKDEKKEKKADKETLKEKPVKKTLNKANKTKANKKCEYDFEDEDEGTKDSTISEKKGAKKIKKSNVKNVADIEALDIATEQTLKDINKWLDDTPRFPDFSSASNSPSHFIGGSVGGPPDVEPDPAIVAAATPIPPKIDDFKKKVENKPSPQQRPKDPKDMFKRRLANKDPAKLVRRREIQRTIERLQPGKSKGNLLSNIQNTNKPEELFPLGPLSKLRESKNSLVVKTDDTAPKLSLGTVLDSFGQQHNFSEDVEKIETETKEVKDEVTEAADPVDPVAEVKPEEEQEVKKDETTNDNKPVVVPEKKEVKAENKATPNLSAWFKAFGAPKVQVTQKKKQDSEEEKKEPEVQLPPETAKIEPIKTPPEETRKVISPEPESPAAPATTRQRRGSTGSSVSERSSFSQDMDSSPRMSIDERIGAYPAPYPSPLHRSPASASPVMASPRQEDPQRPYPTLNGSIRVGFYQDTVSTKSSPDKSCSPRDQPQSPYQQFSEHVYTPPNTIQGSGFYSNPSYYSQNPNYTNPSPVYGERTAVANPSPSPVYGDRNQTPNSPVYERTPVPDPSPPVYGERTAVSNPSPVYGERTAVPNPSPPVYGDRSAPPFYDTTKSLTEQYNATKVPNIQPASFQSTSEDSINSPEAPANPDTFRAVQQPLQQIQQPQIPQQQQQPPPQQPQQQQQPLRIPEKQPTMFPVKKRLYSENETIQREDENQEQSQQQHLQQQQLQQQQQQIHHPQQDLPGNRLEMGLLSGRQLNINPSTQHLSTNMQEIRPSSREQQQQQQQQQQKYVQPEAHPPEQTYQRPDSRGLNIPINKPSFDAQNQMNLQQNINMQLPNQQLNIPMRSMNFPTTSANLQPYNLQNHENTYSMNRPPETEDRSKLDMTKLANMCYSNVDMSRSQFYNRPPSAHTTSNTPTQNTNATTPTEHMNLSMRYASDTRLAMGYRAAGLEIPRTESQTTQMAPIQNADMIQVPQATRTPAANMTNRMGQVENYKQEMPIPRSSFTSPSGLIDQSLNLRGNLANLSNIVDRFHSDDRLLSSLQTSTAYYSDKGLSSPHMFAKGISTANTVTSSLPMFSQPSIGIQYGREMQQPYTRTMTELQNPSMFVQSGKTMHQQPPTYAQSQQVQQNVQQQQQQQQQQQVQQQQVQQQQVQQQQVQQQQQQVQQTVQQQQQQQVQIQPDKKSSRKRKTKQQPIPNETPPSTINTGQGFQSYAGLKNSTEPSAISLKTASVVPGSAFNFGPGPNALGLSTGLYGEKDSYTGFLDEYRSAPSNYYMHRTTPETSTDKSQPRNAHQQTPTAPTASFPFLGHPQPRAPGYASLAAPFMGAHTHQSHAPLMDPNSPIYQQYLLHQGLLGPPAGYPPGYHPALSMRQPYDSMTRPSWL